MYTGIKGSMTTKRTQVLKIRSIARTHKLHTEPIRSLCKQMTIDATKSRAKRQYYDRKIVSLLVCLNKVIIHASIERQNSSYILFNLLDLFVSLNKELELMFAR